MKKPALLHKIKLWLLRFLQVQLFINAISLPILISWGLPISVMSPVGNLVFSPFLFLFLLLCSFIFFLELLFLPNGFFIFLLQKLTCLWTKLLSFGNDTNFLVGFGRPPAIFLCAIALCAFFILYNRYTRPLVRSIILLAILLGSSSCLLKLFCVSKNFVQKIDCKEEKVTLAHSNGQTILIDPGVIGKKPSGSSWVQYTLAPEVTSSTGKNTIEYVILLQPGIRTFQAIETLCSTMHLDTIFLVYWNGTLQKNGWRAFFHLKRAAKKHGINLVRIGKQKLTVPLGKKNKLLIQPTGQTLQYHDATYPALQVSGQIDNEEFTLYAASYKEKGALVR